MIRILPESIVRSIAAGEVIERPSSVVRELLENSVDAGANSIDLALVEGGIKRIWIRDNGMGMSVQDVEICLLPHATSKIIEHKDLLSINTLGFRGEALSSIATCSRIQISSSQGEESGRSITSENSKVIAKQDVFMSYRGTIVEVEDIFFHFPARRRFLKRAHTEYLSCREVFEDIALCHPKISFKLIKGKKLDVIYPAGSFKERLEQVWSDQLKGNNLIWLENKTDNISLQFIGAKPSLFRRDRRFMKVFVNGRKVENLNLLEVISRSYEGFLSEGLFPYACLHLTISPALVDFNVHPAKKEVRFTHLPHLIEFLIRSIRTYFYKHLNEFFLPLKVKEDGESSDTFKKSFHFYDISSAYSSDIDLSSVSKLREEPFHLLKYKEREGNSPITLEKNPTFPSCKRALVNSHEVLGFKYLGQFIGRYLVLEFKRKLVLVDQHSAHKRILFEGFRANSSNSQKLLFPYLFSMKISLSSEQMEVYSEVGVQIKLIGRNPETSLWEYELVGLPRLCFSMESLIVEFVKKETDHFYLVKDLFFELYCHLASQRATKAGEPLTYERALKIIGGILENRWFSCPQGKPLWLEFKESYFDNLIRRT